MPRSVKIAFAGGGTGGHLFPALAIIEEIASRTPVEIEYFGSARGPEARIIPQKGYQFHKIWIKGYPRRLKPEVFLIPLQVFVSLFQCMWCLLKFWPSCLVATGGYVSLPFMLAGKLMGFNIVIHEQNSLPGLTTKIGAAWAKTVFYSFEVTEKYFKNHRDAVLSGNPARINLAVKEKSQALRELGLDPSRKTILIFGGSQGAATLNRAVSQAIDRITSRYNLIWQTGKGNLPDVVPPGAVAGEFFDDMGALYSAADLAFCRAGAMTLTEIAAVGLPAVLVPFPFAAEDHQRLNAEPLADAGVAELVLDKDFDGEIMLQKAGELLEDGEKLRRMSQNIKSFHRPQAAKIIADRIIEIANKKFQV